MDNELDAREFRANSSAAKPFVRKFDRWAAMLRHDKDRNGTIDWFEAKAYREALRKRILSRFDTDRNGKLKGAERDAANRALAGGTVARAAGRPAASAPLIDIGSRWTDLKKKYDADGDGKVSSGEWGDYWKELRDSYDADKDGRLGPEERAKMMSEQWGASAGGVRIISARL